MKKWIMIFIFLITLPTTFMLAANAGTKFQFYVPANNDNVRRHVCVVISSFNDNTYVELIDDNADGDDDDSWSGYLQKGETYVRYIKDGSVNDDAGGKWDGDYFLVNSDKPVVVSQSTNSDWQHDWVPADNTTMKGTIFYIYAPPTSYSPRDINLFAYEDSTFFQIKDITVSPKTTSGKTAVNLDAYNLVASGYLNLNEELIYSKTTGRDILNPGSTYLVQTSKPVTVQYGALWKNEKDGGGFVPGATGSSSDNLFYFTIPNQNNKRQREIRIISFDDNVSVNLEGYNGSNWQTVKTYNLNAFGHADFLARGAQDNMDLFRITSTNGNVSVFEANWLESGSYGTSDVYSSVSSENGDAAGNSFLVYLAPPGYEKNCVDPFTGLKFSQMGLNGLTHALISARYENTTVTIKDTDTDGNIINTTVNIDAGRYYDFRVDTNLFEQLRTNGNRPYLTITSTQPVSVSSTNWNDNWMTYMSSSQPGSIEVNSTNSSNSSDNPTAGETVTFSSAVVNSSSESISNTETVVTIADGLNYQSSQLVSSTQGNLGEGTTSELSSGEETVTWNNYNLNPGDVLSAEIVVSVDSVLANGANIPNNSNVNVTTTSSGDVGGETVVTQNTSVLTVENNNQNQINDSYVLSFEDMKDIAWNDWDVNDFVVEVSSTVNTDDFERITDITFNYEALARGSSFDHVFKHRIALYGNSVITLTVKDSNNTVIRSVGPVSRNGEFTENIFNSTKEALPPLDGGLYPATNTSNNQDYYVKGYTATLNIQVDSDQNPISVWGSSSSDPYIYVVETGKNIHVASIAGNGVGNTQNLDNNIDVNQPLYGHSLDLAYKNNKNWKWPYEGSSTVIWNSYQDYIPYITSGKSIYKDWHLNPQEGRVWQRNNGSGNQPLKTPSLADSDYNKGFANISSSGEKGYFSSPKLFDLDDDGNLEILIGSIDEKFYAYDINENLVKGFPLYTDGIIRSTAAISKIDGTKAIIAFGSDDGKLYAYDNSGQPYNGFPFQSAGPIKSSPSITDIDLDGEKEIIFNSGDGKVYIVSLSGKLFPDFPVEVQKKKDSYGNMIILPSPSVGDLNNDGTKEIVLGTSDSTITVISAQGKVMPGFPVRLNNLVYSSPIITKYNDETAILVISGSGEISIFNHLGEKLNSLSLGDDVISSPAIADIDNDGIMEIIVPTINGNIISVKMDNTLSTMWSNKVVTQIFSSPIIADLNGDTDPEIVITGLNGITYILNNDGNLDMTLMEDIPQSNSATYSTPTIEDIDNDEKLEMVTASYDKEIEIIEFSRTNKNSKVLWGGFGKDISNSNSTDSISSVETSSESLGRVFNYPNPVTGESTRIRIEGPQEISDLEVLIFDLGGELVKTISKDDFQRSGFFWDYEWNLMNDDNKSISNGAYLYKVKLDVDGKSFQKYQKLAIIR